MNVPTWPSNTHWYRVTLRIIKRRNSDMSVSNNVILHNTERSGVIASMCGPRLEVHRQSGGMGIHSLPLRSTKIKQIETCIYSWLPELHHRSLVAV